ncbi:hypothetical protein [Neobacillus cucumis]|uniref:Uncharacterized protein n=1 Tax=Neobacillus cucumis TaxID=1740721 RepID=A0A2N5HEV6_9BACI|nr:hypothetical protein [Neobacillus cucumis]PLS04035.1 hypothetical protein CVD27_12815 [Neobacillus cucumis]
MSDNKLTLQDLRTKYQFDKKLRKYSDRHYSNDNSVFGKVTSNIDVVQHRNYLVNTLEYYKKISPLVRDDIKDVEAAMARYEIAVRKVIQNFDNQYSNFEYDAEELNELIEDVFTQQENVNKLLFRKLMQD